MAWWTWFAWSFGGECEQAPLRSERVELGGVRAVEVRGIEGALEIVPTEGTAVVASGEACPGTLAFEVVREGDVLVVRTKGDADRLEAQVALPRAVAALTVRDGVGPTSVERHPAGVSARSMVGPLDVEDVGSLAVDHVTGPVNVERIAGAVTVRVVTGPVSIEDVRGNVATEDVTGPVAVEDVDGSFVNRRGTGPVFQEDVRGGP